MMLPLQEILNKYNVHPKGVIHVGVHWAEEHEEFEKIGISNFIYIEPCKDAYRKLVDKIVPNPTEDIYSREYTCFCTASKDMSILKSYSLVNMACADYEGESVMYVSHHNQGQSNSLLKPLLHEKQHPEVVFNDAEIVMVSTLDKIIEKWVYSITPKDERKGYNILMIDVQGAEGLVLKGATEILQNIDLVYTECNRDQTYEGNMEIEEMDAFLADYGFKRVETFWPSPNWTWGDCAYVKQG